MAKIRLFTYSFLMLFSEMVLIRFISGNIKIYGYFSNLVLIASFLGMGLGFLLAGIKRNFIFLFPFAITALIMVVTYSKILISGPLDGGTVLKYFSEGNLKVESVGSLMLIFILVVLAFVFLGQAAGKLFVKFKPLTAYSIDIIGSISGIIAFSIVSFFSVPALYWFLIMFVLCLALIWTNKSFFFGSLLVFSFCLVFLFVKEDKTANWSPYYKITYRPAIDQQNNLGYVVMANNIFHQFIGGAKNREDFYYYPYSLFADHSYKNILVIGSGNGVDAAVALAKDPLVESIDAVEIDPEIYKLGKKLNPDRPYENPKVNIYIDDGRGFLERTVKKYDLIIYGETDSIILVNNTSGVRLESFLYTTDAFKLVKKHLAQNGVFFLFNTYRDDWVIQKLAMMSQIAFGQPPYMIVKGDTIKYSTIINGPKTEDIEKSFPGLRLFQSDGKITVATDNWPFLFLKNMSVPVYYLNILIGLALITLFAYFAARKLNSSSGFDPRFMSFGIGFMLLETKSLVNFAQLFGSTWLVNSLVIVAILAFVLLANYINSIIKFRKVIILYIILFILLILQFVVSAEIFAGLGIIERYIAAAVFYLSPVFVANLIFARSFKNTKNSSVKFGSNILGGAIGGFLEYMALATGYRSLALIVIICYIFTLIPHRSIDLA